MIPAIGYAAAGPRSALGPMRFARRSPGPQDVAIQILYCGVCHSDLHQVRDDWGNTIYPCVPGHEIVGRALGVGEQVTKFHTGDLVGVGCLVDSCRECEACRQGLEQYCEGPLGPLFTYNGPGTPNGNNTFGGYSNVIVVSVVSDLGGHVALGAGALPSAGLHARQHRGQLVGDFGVFGAQR